jgi:hypothetical protein
LLQPQFRNHSLRSRLLGKEVVRLSALTLSLHGANRILERSVPLEALEGVKFATPILTEKPLRFRYKGVTVIARMASGYPKIISAWKGV